jgi:four helix bundle protein
MVDGDEVPARQRRTADPEGSCVGVFVGVGVGAAGFCCFHATTPTRCRELPVFNFNRLDVYGCAISFFKLAVPLIERTPAGYHSLSDQLRRAAISIPLNIAEASGKYDKDERRFFSIARGSALECAAIVDVFEALGVPSVEEAAQARQVLERIVSMLTKLSSDR